MTDVDADGNLVTENGKKIPPLQVTPALFLDKSIMIYGSSGSGKTSITKHIMKTVNDFIDQILVVSPTEPTNRSYEGFVDAPFIHYRLFLADPKDPRKDDGPRGALRFLEAVWKRQEMMASIYARANNAEVLAGLYGRLPKATRVEGLRYIEVFNSKRSRVIERLRKQYAAEPGICDEKTKEANSKFKKMLVLLYKKYLSPYYEELWGRTDLSEDERYSLAYLHFKPRLLLIFDDCAAMLKPFFAREIFRLLFYQNRHSFITVIMLLHDATDAPANIRKNAFISIYAESIICASNFELASNKFPKATKLFVNEIIGDVFRGHRKLAYIRDDSRRQHFYFMDLPFPKLFRFGSGASHELCEAVASQGCQMDKENPFYEAFKL
jgi:ABC-type transporter Mla maintaining outer membrane lipid asymmetry ATPase subunit MlaF